MAFHENHSRSIIKTLTYRALIILSNIVIVYMITERWDMTFDFVAVSSVTSTLLYFFHERLWNGIHWGKAPIPAKDL